jgi:DnaJ-class molecular chaperone
VTVLRMTIRRPPRCRTCGRSGQSPNVPNRTCPACEGRSAKIEFFVEYGPLTATKAVWENEESGPYARERL